MKIESIIGFVPIANMSSPEAMDDKTKFILALMQIENISNLMKDNQYEGYMVSHLIPMKVEIERQLSNLNRL
jgi:hypothetical protein